MKFKSKNLIWIILLSFATYVASVHTNCDRPPHLENGWTKPLVEDDNGDLVSVTYVCNDGFILQGESELLCNLDTDEWQGEPPTCNSDQTSTERNSKKINIHDIPEDTSIDSEFAKSLDRSCFIEPRIMPPEIENAVVRNLRRQKDGRIFPVAVYTCDEDYELESVDNDRLYCSKRKWIGIYPNCMQLEETYDENGEEEEEEDEDDGDEGEEEDAEEDETEDGNEDTEDRPDEIDNDINNNEIDNNEIDNNEIDNNEIDNNEINEIEGTHKDDRDKPETDPSTVTCSDNQGGCDHKCNVIDNRIQCECFAGFKLDVDDGRTCHDINECDNDNGGCESICINQPGSFKCDCEKGLQIDTVGRTKCLDINECLLRNGHGPCQDTCVNTFGGYRCSCENLPGTKLAKNGRNCEDAGKCAIRNGGCSQGCVSAAGRIYCLCERGYYLESDRKTCQDIDECADPEISAQCRHGCENTPGSYRCKEDTTIAPPSNIIEGEEDNNVESSNVLEAEDVHENEINISLDEDEREDNEDDDENEDENDRDDNNEQDNEIYDQNILKTCGDGYELDENNRCVDIDECAQGNTGCEFCKNVNGGFECFCPDGFDIADDERTCLDIDECEMESDYDVTDDQETYAQSPCSHECVNTHGSYLCLCPDNFHLQYDHRTCIRDFCEHLTDELNKTKCSHQCHDEKDGYVCSCPPGLQLDTDSKTCLVNNNQCEQENHCSPGVCINTNDGYRCECPSGYIEKAKRCHDENECEIGNHHCSHECRNLDGSYECHCPSGYILAADRRTCQDVDECERDDEGDLCGDMDCINTVGSYKCQCPEGEELITVESGSICREIDLCDSETNGGCSHGCKTEQSEVQCYCPDGMKLHADGKHCEIRDHCQPLSKPKNGEIKCFRSRHRTQLFYKTKCTITCQPGFVLIGDEFRQCNGTGHWDQGSSICAPKLCPRLQRPSHGTLTPANCMTGDTFSGQRCVLHCDPGFKPIDRRTAFCEPPKNWLPNPNLNCMPAVAKLEMIRPYIKCPQDSIILLPHGKKTIHVKLQQPNTNVDWWKYVDSHPPWGKKLEAHLTPGIHTILFKARSPNSNLNDVCRTIITVKETHPPTVVFCPESTVEHLQPNEDSRSIYFKEPVFKSEHIKEVYKSKLPGEKFGPGEHVIRYVATDLDDQSTKCEFTISVKPYYRRIIHHNEVIKAKPLANHESYVKCPGKPAVKIDTNFPINLSRGCLIKNIRIPAYSHIRRRHHPSSSNSVLRHYSSWDNPDKPASFIHQYRRGWD
ncbi:fibrillin-1 isoform X2 [Bradysia coprophila]|uniref:fibrillin-1 isoform X2 n=1 Tax=Bradysia coprophila TaxID=38358 RepID=UPI00187DB60A|nr:fibrillin-1 isoform X2 [Bradysia coprophila]